MDSLDRTLIDLLRQDGRASYQELGQRIGLSSSAVKRRVDKLVADGVIRGFTVVTDPAKEGMGTEAFVELFCRGIVGPEELTRILGSIPDVVEASTVTGNADAVVTLRSSDTSRLELALEQVRLAPQVNSTRSAIVLSRLIERR